MKRIKAACLLQTVHFQLKDGISSEYNKAAVQHEYEAYKAQMTRRNTKYKILEETTMPDGSIMIRLMKQNNTQPVGDYFND